MFFWILYEYIKIFDYIFPKDPHFTKKVLPKTYYVYIHLVYP